MSILLLTILANLLIGSVVLTKTKSSPDKVVFFLLTLSISIWSVVNHLSLTSTNAAWILIWMRAVMFTAVLQLFFFNLFVLSYTKKMASLDKKGHLLYVLYVIASALILLLTLTPWLFYDINFDATTLDRSPAFNPIGMIFFGIYTLSTIAAGILIMIKSLIAQVGNARKSLALMLTGILLMFGLMITFNFILPAAFNITSFIELGPIFTLPFVYLTAIGIIEYDLFKIKIITSRILLSIVGFILLIELFSLGLTKQYLAQTVIMVLLGTLGIYLIKKIEQERFGELKKLLNLTREHKELKSIHQANMAFISDIAHRLKTPLAIIQTQSSSDQPVTTDNLHKINEVAKTTVATLRNIVQTGKIDAELVKLNRKTINLSDWLAQQRPELMAIAPAHTVSIKTPGHPTSSVDPLYLREALYNLVDNARKFSPVGSTIEVSAHIIHDQIEISVQDHGVGINPQDLAHIFERHYQALGTRQQFTGSAGLGLSLVKWVAEAHSGHISVTSTPNRGTIFFLSLPTAEPDPLHHPGQKPIKQIATER